MLSDIPILFSAPMILAHLAGRKTMTRRILSPRYVTFFDGQGASFRPTKEYLAQALTEVSGLRRVDGDIWTWQAKAFPHQHAERTNWMAHINPAPGTRMWVRERTTVTAARDGEIKVSYDADRHAPDVWFPFPDRLKQKAITGQRLSMGCYRETSRITDTVTAVKIERAQDISEPDAVAEGIQRIPARRDGFGDDWTYLNGVSVTPSDSAAGAFADLWSHLHGWDSWVANPYVVGISYTVVKANIDAPEARAA